MAAVVTVFRLNVQRQTSSKNTGISRIEASFAMLRVRQSLPNVYSIPARNGSGSDPAPCWFTMQTTRGKPRGRLCSMASGVIRASTAQAQDAAAKRRCSSNYLCQSSRLALHRRRCHQLHTATVRLGLSDSKNSSVSASKATPNSRPRRRQPASSIRPC